MTPRPIPSSRVMTFVWVGAVVIALGSMTAVLRATEDTDLILPAWLKPAPFGVAIGTSLFRNAFPPELSASDDFADAGQGDRILRVSLTNQSNTETMSRLRRATALGVKEIFVEVDPILRTLRSEQESESFPVLGHWSARLRGAVVNCVRFQFGSVDADMMDRSFYKDAYDGGLGAMAQFYPARVHAPLDPSAIAEVSAVAKQQGLRIVWVAMPRSETATNYLGSGFRSAFDGQLKAFADRFGARIWRPAESWPDQFFVDQAHLNAAGRARFLQEFRLYNVASR